MKINFIDILAKLIWQHMFLSKVELGLLFSNLLLKSELRIRLSITGLNRYVTENVHHFG